MSTAEGVTEQPLLDVQELSVVINTERGAVTVINQVSLTVLTNEVLCIVGESGSGKSVTMLSVMRLMDERATEYSGRVRFDGTDLLSLSAAQMQRVRGGGIAMIFQDPMTALNPVYRIGWQIAEQLRAHTDLSAAQARESALQLLAQVGISDPQRRIDEYPHQLSGGMRQRVMIALALSCRPRILIADEPTTALDVTIQAQILQLISDLKTETSMSVVLVTHDMGVVAEMADRVQVMYGGRVVEQGTADELFNNAQHPYTWGLLASIPRLDRSAPRRLRSIAGTPASAGQLGPECVFAARCPHRFAPCAVHPELLPAPARAAQPPAESTPTPAETHTHRVACHLPPAVRAQARTRDKELE